jgi:hypothetical protein
MKRLNKHVVIPIIVALVALIAGYILGNLLPLSRFSTGGGSTSQTTDKGQLLVQVTDTEGGPVVGLEVDVAVQPGPPEEWGIATTDAQGVVQYDLDPGTYYVFFNTSNFPSEYVVQPERQTTITAAQKINMTFELERK